MNDTGQQMTGRYKPHEIGQLCIWQVRNLFRHAADKPEIHPQDHYQQYLYRQKQKGESAFEVWRKWRDELEPIYSTAKNSKGK